MHQLSRQQQDIITQSVEEVLTSYGYAKQFLAIVEHAELFLTRAGNAIIEKLFVFDQQGHEMALRPEFTAQAVEQYINSSHDQSHDQIVRWQFSGPVFELTTETGVSLQEKPNIGVELIGQSGATADAEVIAMAAEALQTVLPTRLYIGHTGLLTRVLQGYGFDAHTIRRFLAGSVDDIGADGSSADNIRTHAQPDGATQNDRHLTDREQSQADKASLSPTQSRRMLDVLLDSTNYSQTMGGRTRQEIVDRMVSKQQHGAPQWDEAYRFFTQWRQIEASPAEAFPLIEQILSADETVAAMLQQWKDTIRLLDIYGIDTSSIVLRPHLTQKWDYYSGIVFSFHHDSPDDTTQQAAQKQYVASGGRYDGLVEILGGQPGIPSIGFTINLDRIFDRLSAAETAMPARTLYAFPHQTSDAIRLIQQLRRRGIPVAMNITPAADEANHTSKHLMLQDDHVLWMGNTYAPDEIDGLVDALRQLQISASQQPRPDHDSATPERQP